MSNRLEKTVAQEPIKAWRVGREVPEDCDGEGVPAVQPAWGAGSARLESGVSQSREQRWKELDAGGLLAEECGEIQGLRHSLQLSCELMRWPVVKR